MYETTGMTVGRKEECVQIAELDEEDQIRFTLFSEN